AMPSKDPPFEVDDVPRRLGLGPEPLHQSGVITVRDEADVLAVRLGRNFEAELPGDPPHLVLRQIAEREAQEIELLARGAVKKVALIAARVGALVQLCAMAVQHPPDVVPGRKAIRAKLT